MTVCVIFWAIQQAKESRDDRFRKETARQGRVTVDDIQAKIEAGRRQVHQQLAMDTVIRHDREFDAENAAATTTRFAAVADVPEPEERDVCVPKPRSARRRLPGRLLECRAAVGRGGDER